MVLRHAVRAATSAWAEWAIVAVPPMANDGVGRLCAPGWRDVTGKDAMKGRAIRILVGIGLLFLSIALAARGAALVAAEPLPTIATPTSAHVTLVMTESMSDATTGESFELTVSGQGDFD